MNTAVQQEIMPETHYEWVNALSDEACRLHDLGLEAYGCGRLEEAEGHFRYALALFEQAEGAEHPDVAAVHCNLGATLEDQCEFLAAEECYVDRKSVV